MVCTTRSKLWCNHGFPRSRHGPYYVTRTLLGTHQQRKHDSAGSSQYQTSLHSKVSKHNLVWNHLSSRKDWQSALSHAIHPGHTKVWIRSDSLGIVRAIVFTEFYRTSKPYMLLLFSVFFSPLFLESRMGPLIVWLRLHSVTWTACGHEPNFYDNSAVQKKKVWITETNMKLITPLWF